MLIFGGEMKSIVGIAIIIISFVASASDYKCSEWTKRAGVSCVFAGSSADSWERQCENSCWRGRYGLGNWGPECDLERVCSPEDPRKFQSVCSEWIEDASVTCRNPSTGDWEQKWARVCTVGVKETWCSDEDPNRL
jgi:hypothetical protein